MFKSVLVCLAMVMAFLFTTPAVNSNEVHFVPLCNVVQAQGSNIWFYSRSGLDYWLTKATNEGDNVYTVSVTATNNGQFHQLYVYRVTAENGLAYTSSFDRMSGKWGAWYHNDFAQSLWRAVQENY